jgi:hypothetical protein
LLYLPGIPAPHEGAAAVDNVAQHLELEPRLHACADDADGPNLLRREVFCGNRSGGCRTLVGKPAFIEKN